MKNAWRSHEVICLARAQLESLQIRSTNHTNKLQNLGDLSEFV
jgi:hypothetical protein